MTRRDTYRVDSSDVQGKDSWVELKAISRAEWKELVAARPDTTEELVEDYLVAWNWKDRDGNDLPLAVEDLTQVEYNFLVRSLVAPPAITPN